MPVSLYPFPLVTPLVAKILRHKNGHMVQVGPHLEIILLEAYVEKKKDDHSRLRALTLEVMVL